MPLTLRDFKRYEECKTLDLDNIESLEAVNLDQSIEVLRVSHFHRASTLSLEPLQKLLDLRFLSLSTTASWDGTGKKLYIDSFSHLSGLPKLETIQILGVVPREDRLEPLAEVKSLQIASIGNTSFYTVKDFARLANAQPQIRGIKPLCRMNFTLRCKQCKWRPLLFLQGYATSAKNYVCSKCDHSRIAKHLEEWNQAGGLPAYQRPENLSPRQLRRMFPVG